MQAQPEQMGDATIEQAQRHDQRQRPRRVPHEDALAIAADRTFELLDLHGIVGVVAVDVEPSGGPVFDEIEQGQRGQTARRTAQPRHQEHGRGRQRGQQQRQTEGRAGRQQVEHAQILAEFGCAGRSRLC